MNHDTPASPLDGDEGETTASTRLEAEGTTWLAQHGDDSNGNDLGTKSEDIMSHGRRVFEKQDKPRPEFISEVALHFEASPRPDIDAEIDAKRQHRVGLQRYYISLTKPCNDARRYERIEAGLRLIADAQSDFELDVIAGAIRRDCKILGIHTPANMAAKLLVCKTYRLNDFGTDPPPVSFNPIRLFKIPGEQVVRLSGSQPFDPTHHAAACLYRHADGLHDCGKRSCSDHARSCRQNSTH